MLRRLLFAVAWLGWVGVILAIVIPWNDFQGHTHWGKVAWIPFVSPPLKISDVVANVVIYLPFGFLGRRTTTGRWAPVVIAVLAGLLSFGTEASQLYSHQRFPSATDIVCNLLGTVGGIYFAQASTRSVRDTFSQEIPS